MKLLDDKPKLSIFKTFKTKRDQLTGEAIRQRSIIANLATEPRHMMNTRTSLAHKVAERSNTIWQNVYSGIFRDIDEVLLPLGIVEEAGRLPLKRGPRALQEHGVPYYKLTESGMLVAVALDELKDERIKILKKFLENDDMKEEEFREVILKLLNVAPNFVFELIRKYIESHVNGEIDKIIPFNSNRLGDALDGRLAVYGELLEGFSTLTSSDRDSVISFFQSHLASKH
ncbi:MAG TPA: hypothetical protein VLD38_03005 [Nitrosopumilaceae archaeon]|nr:hypothetical protein [Nitrosopumilaceae archaeon]